jgi:hypothetical protein
MLMTNLKLNKNFGHLLAPVDFLPNTTRILTIRGQSKNNHLIKQQVMETESISIPDIKSIEIVTFGKGDDKIDVTEKVKLIMINTSKINHLTNIEKIFSEFSKTFLKLLCPRCYKEKTKLGTNLHNSGYINLLLLDKPIEYYNSLCDGIIKCFIAFLINVDETIINVQKGRWNECFSHILMNKPDKENNLHFNTVNKIHTHYMSDMSHKPIDLKMKDNTRLQILIFYSHMYPVLKYFFNNRKDIFIRHGLEKNTTNYKENMVFPPNDDDNGWRIHKITDKNNNYQSTKYPAYPIEIDTLPLEKCAAHSKKEIYGIVKGFISRKDFIQSGGHVRIRYDKNDDIMAREHFFAESAIPIKKWVFTYTVNPAYNMRNETKAACHAIISANLPLISEESLSHFHTISELILKKFIMLH